MNKKILKRYKFRGGLQYIATTATLAGGAAAAATLGHASSAEIQETAFAVVKTLAAARIFGAALVGILTKPVIAKPEQHLSDISVDNRIAITALNNFHECREAAGVSKNVQLRQFKKPHGIWGRTLPAFTTPYLASSVVVLGGIAWDGMSSAEQKGVIAHELSHIKMRHILMRRFTLACLIATTHLMRLHDFKALVPGYAQVLLSYAGLACMAYAAKGTETQADMQAALITKEPQALKSSFKRLGGEENGRKFSLNLFHYLYSQHPPLPLRMHRLNEASTNKEGFLEQTITDQATEDWYNARRQIRYLHPNEPIRLYKQNHIGSFTPV